MEAPSEISELTRCRAVFLPGDPARTGDIAFWRPDGEKAPPTVPASSARQLRLVRPLGAGVSLARVPAVLLPVRDALPVLTRARVEPETHRSTAFWSAAALLALRCAARGLLLPGLSAEDHDAWRMGPLGAEDVEQVRRLAASMPPEAHAVPVDESTPLRLPDPERLLRAFLDAVADTLPRTPAAELVTGAPAYAARPPQRVPELRAWAADVCAAHDAGVRISLRIEVSGLDLSAPDLPAPQRPCSGGPALGLPEAGGTQTGEPEASTPPEDGGSASRFRAVPQVHGVSDPALVADAAAFWADPGGLPGAPGPHARREVLLALRRAARAWPPLAPLLSATVPEAVDLLDDEVVELLTEGWRARAHPGVGVARPKELARTRTDR
ncbi:ATP-dependent helicase, partial [Streptomyces sp. NPDC001500]